MYSTDCEVIGVDVSKDKLDVAGQKLAQFSNDNKGIRSLIRWVKKQGEKPFVVMEATGAYHGLLAEMLSESEMLFSVANPKNVRDFAKAMGILAKTDAIDARVIREYGQKRALEPQKPIPVTLKKLRALVQRREQVKGMLVQEKNRVHALRDKELLSLLKKHIAVLKDEQKTIDGSIKNLIKSDPALNEQIALMTSLKGIKITSAANLYAFLPELGSLTKPQVTALAGLAPYNDDSGKLKYKRRIMGGRAIVRSSIYICAMVAARWSPTFRSYYLRLQASGKQKKTALVAVARKIIIVLNAMLRSNTPFSETVIA